MYNRYIHTHTKKGIQYKTKESHQIRREENKRGKEEQNKSKTINKMAISTYR